MSGTCDQGETPVAPLADAVQETKNAYDSAVRCFTRMHGFKALVPQRARAGIGLTASWKSEDRDQAVRP